MNNQNKVLSYLYNQCKMEHFYYFWLRHPVHLVSAFPSWHNTKAEALSELETLSLTICPFILFCSKGSLRSHVHMAIGHSESEGELSALAVTPSRYYRVHDVHGFTHDVKCTYFATNRSLMAHQLDPKIFLLCFVN